MYSHTFLLVLFDIRRNPGNYLNFMTAIFKSSMKIYGRLLQKNPLSILPFLAFL